MGDVTKGRIVHVTTMKRNQLASAALTFNLGFLILQLVNLHRHALKAEQRQLRAIMPTKDDFLYQRHRGGGLPTNETWQQIDASCLDPTLPTPTILMTLGRSGSSSTWETLSKLTGNRSRAIEYVGTGTVEIVEFFRKREHRNHGQWLIDHMCSLQRNSNSTEGIVGFKWKSFLSALDNNEPAEETFQMIGKLAKDAKREGRLPPIRVLRSRRNPLDVALSRHKHYGSPNRPPPHCVKTYANFESCMEQHRQKRPYPDVNGLYAFLSRLVETENQVDFLLDRWGVPTVSLSYESLYFPETPEEGSNEWTKAMEFVKQEGVPSKNATWTQVQAMMEHSSTSPRKHKDVIANYEEVHAALVNTEFEHLLR